jgi:hypothetical protein
MGEGRYERAARGQSGGYRTYKPHANVMNLPFKSAMNNNLKMKNKKKKKPKGKHNTHRP